ncbi:MAG: rhodanese-related sulfurtransferase [Chthonomonas sp.]|nr:rhodanese-related sulfurtransferase [Chthonomonas sp.]
MGDYRVLLYYHFAPIDDVERFRDEHFNLCQSLGLRGRIIVASEGINGTCSGTAEACDAYKAELWAQAGFETMVFKEDADVEHRFKKLFVRVRPEIISLGEQPPADAFGNHLSPVEFERRLHEAGTIVIDGRNDYESDIGHFEGALCPPVENFRDFPAWIRSHLAESKDAQILTYCTGGIRCEKLVAWMRMEGFTNVWQLQGGIVTYGQDPEVQGKGFVGQCYVFDDRIAVPINRTENAQPLTHCVHCNQPCERYVNCLNVECNRLFACCEACERECNASCSPACQEADFRREPGAKLPKPKGARKRAPATRISPLLSS